MNPHLLTSFDEARILLKDGDLFLNPVVDVDTKRVKTVKRLPAISMQRCDDMMGNFQDLDAAFRQIDPISLAIIERKPIEAAASTCRCRIVRGATSINSPVSTSCRSHITIAVFSTQGATRTVDQSARASMSP